MFPLKPFPKSLGIMGIRPDILNPYLGRNYHPISSIFGLRAYAAEGGKSIRSGEPARSIMVISPTAYISLIFRMDAALYKARNCYSS